jgi:hypothetical protein
VTDCQSTAYSLRSRRENNPNWTATYDPRSQEPQTPRARTVTAGTWGQHVPRTTQQQDTRKTTDRMSGLSSHEIPSSDPGTELCKSVWCSRLQSSGILRRVVSYKLTGELGLIALMTESVRRLKRRSVSVRQDGAYPRNLHTRHREYLMTDAMSTSETSVIFCETRWCISQKLSNSPSWIS